VQANESLGFPADLRNYGVGAQILTDLGINRLRLLTNNPRKIAGLGGYGLKVEARVPLVIRPGDHNASYLAVKREKLGHLIDTSDKSETQNDQPVNDQTPFVAVAWDGDVNGEELSALREQAEQWASSHHLSLTTEHSPRLLALWERPLFVWRVTPRENTSAAQQSPIDKASLESLLRELAQWSGTLRVGLLCTENINQALHPSQDLERVECSMPNLINVDSEPLKGWGSKSIPTLVLWSSSL
ncbi:MAG: bifunctional 3,4-dihydroxy-2-butanone-4-phosphate synthase/GTP cyclohydrolase II, partial [Prochlorococcus sp.]|nr:bifunctional 3,4-dihydroxy-2-butanone-4-phosphate synthase/GTP cyclohydrolase II [Prochlorococcus sp.]